MVVSVFTRSRALLIWPSAERSSPLMTVEGTNPGPLLPDKMVGPAACMAMVRSWLGA